VSNGIDFVIGGKDKASPAMDSAAKSMRKLETGAERLGNATKSLMATFAPLLAVYGAVKSVMAATDFIKNSSEAYDIQTAAVNRLEVALKLQGAAVEGESARLQTFAGDMQKLTGVGDELTLGLMNQAAMMGVNSEQLDDAAKAAIGLSEATGKSLDESLKMVTNSLQGEFGAFGEVIPAIKTMQTEEEKLAAVLALSAKGLEAKTEASNTVAGMSERASGAVGDLMESVGALIAPVRILISQGIKTLAESMQTLLVPAVEYANSVLANIGPLMDWVKEKVVAGVNLMVGAFTFFEVVISNLDKIWVAMVAQAELYLLQMSGAVMHALTVTIPAYASWFAENFVNLIRDGLMLAFTVVTNHVTKIIDAFKALWDFIASGGQTDVLGQLGDIAGRSYLEGFESSLTDLPEIAGRKISEREKELAATIGQIGADLGEEFSTKFAERMVGMGDGLSDEFSKEIDLKVNKKIDDQLGTKSGGALGPLSASESRLLTRGPADKQADLLTKLLNEIKKTVNPIINSEAAAMEAASALQQIAENTDNTTQLVPTT
jgi:hypothetical protein